MPSPRRCVSRLSISLFAVACIGEPVRAQQAGAAEVQLDAIDVQAVPQAGAAVGYVAKRSPTATKTDTPLAETAQSVSVVTHDQIVQQDAQNLNDALRYTSGVTPESRGVGGTRYDLLKVRGFDAVTYLNGLRLLKLDFAAPQIDPYLLDRIEVLKGPTSVLYGQSPAGGLINQISKMPLSESYREVGIEFGNYGHQQYTFDLSGPTDHSGTVLYRITGVGRADDGQVTDARSKRIAIAPAVTWRPDAASELTLLGLYQHDPEANTYAGVPARGSVTPNPFGRLPRSLNTSEPSLETFDRTEGALGYQFTHHFDDAVTLRMNGRWFRTEVDYASVYGLALASNGRTLSRAYTVTHDELDAFTADNSLETKFATGPLAHTLVTGFDAQAYDGFYRSGTGPAPSLDVFAPTYGRTVATPTLHRTDADGQQYGAYAQDEIRFGGFIATLAGRSDWADSLTRTTTARTDQDDHASTGRWGLLYHFDSGVAPYVSYAESLTPLAGTSFGGAAFKPEYGTQYEAGVKYQPLTFNALFTAAVFDLTRTNVLTTDPRNLGYSVQAGEARSRGLELEARVGLAEGLDLVGAYTHLDVRYTRDNSGLQGKVPVGVPADEAALWTHYTIQDGSAIGLGLGAGLRYVGSTFNTTNTITVPAVTLVDAALDYDLGKLNPTAAGARLTVNAKNIFDKTYVAACYTAATCAYGFGRTVTAGLRYTW